MDILQQLYNSEINAGLWWSWDGGIEVRLGNGIYNDEKNWEASDNVRTIDEAIKWLEARAFEFYPDSQFTKARKTN